VSSGCAHPDRQPALAPSDSAAKVVSTASRTAAPHRPRHQGHADLSTGLYIREDDDLVVDTPLPLILRRTYNSGDGFSRVFGMDATHAGEWWLHGDGDSRIPWADLILADGGRIHFVRISPGDTQETAVLRHDSTPSEFNGATLRWTGAVWEMRFPEGTVAFFSDCQHAGEHCRVLERRDASGHRIVYGRDGSGTLRRMESDGQNITFEYDDRGRIVFAHDTSGHAVWYSYDDRGRLVSATTSERIVRTYEYDDRDNLTCIREPGRVVRNWYDENKRWARQVVGSSDMDPDPYVATARYVVEEGSIVESDFNEGNGLIVNTYNASHYIVSEVLDADSPLPIRFSYNLDSVGNRSNGVTMACVGPGGPIVRTVRVASVHDDAGKEAAIRQGCVRRD
jgi:YD repeat-containing protein